ncbi:hypothetical protein IH799_07300 [candidate division KSB1 bacterium]|nr:hypothetical protein [candidate division KSB1 bacterium]
MKKEKWGSKIKGQIFFYSAADLGYTAFLDFFVILGEQVLFKSSDCTPNLAGF